VWCRGPRAALLVLTERSAAVLSKNPPQGSKARSAAEHLHPARAVWAVWPVCAQAVLHCPVSLARSAVVLPKNLPVLASLMEQSAVGCLSLAQTRAMAPSSVLVT
jgi:hypothetical protein